MSRTHNRKKVPFTENYKSLNRDFSDIDTNIEMHTKKLINRMFSMTKRSISFKIILASGNAPLNIYDEKVYECYVQLINYYRAVMNVYDENKNYLENKKVKDILEGIYSVVCSRVKLAGETNINIEQNPITLEKRLIIGKSTNYFMKNFDIVQNKYIADNMNEIIEKCQKSVINTLNYDENLDTCKNLLNSIEKDCFEKFHQIYIESVKLCINGLNDIEKRKETYYYFELLRKEEEILSSIVKIQIDALEKEIYGESSTDSEKEVVNKILESLKESYQYFAKDASEILYFFDHAPNNNHVHALDEYENFNIDIKTQINIKELFPEDVFVDLKTKFTENFDNIKKQIKIIFNGLYNREITKYNVNIEPNDYEEELTKLIVFSDDMNKVFAKIHNYLLSENELEKSENFPIIKGIDETIVIKIESIEENKDKFIIEWQENIDKFSKTEYSEEDKKVICNKAFECAIERILSDFSFGLHVASSSCKPTQPNKDIKNIKSILEECFFLCFEAEFKQKFIKLIEKQKNTISKLSLNYKKEVLLYEISTFEEIMNYSIPKLKESNEDDTLKYAEMVERYFFILNEILNENNIIVIAPKPHETFNGKEHDVLMVEKNEQFSKGEIIKLMNCGYKENDIVLMRANVIAAK